MNNHKPDFEQMYYDLATKVAAVTPVQPPPTVNC
jgi:hypothetical protein